MENAGIQSDNVRVATLGDYLGEKVKQTESPDISELTERALKKLKEKRKGAKVFCVSCGAQKRTLRKWHNSYLCTDCYKIMENAGEEQFIKALQGEDK